MATRRANVSGSADQLAARLAELDALPLTERARLTFTDDNGRSFGWNEYRASVLSAYEKITSAPAGGSSLEQQAQGPFTFYG